MSAKRQPRSQKKGAPVSPTLSGPAKSAPAKSRNAFWIAIGIVGLLGSYLVWSLVWSGHVSDQSNGDNGVTAGNESPPGVEDSMPITLGNARQSLSNGDLSKAEQLYRKLLEREPRSIPVRMELAKLLGTCGRRSDAIPLVVHLIATGNADDLVLLLARENGVIADLDLLRKGSAKNPPDPLGLLGLAWHAADAGRHQEAMELLQRAIELAPDLDHAHALLGMQFVAAGEINRIPVWNDNLPPSAERLAETWFVRGVFAENAGEVKGAIRCYVEAANRSPDAKAAYARLVPLLAQSGQGVLAEKCRVFSEKLRMLSELQDRVFFASEPSDVETLLELIARYESVGRLWEAFAFAQLAGEIAPDRPEVQSAFNRFRTSVSGLRTELFDPRALPLQSFPLEEYPIPNLKMESRSQATTTVRTAEGSPTPLYRFEDASDESFIDFRYFNGAAEPERRMYEFTGGGIGVLDFDLDGWPDVFFSQGCRWPPGETNSEPFRDMLFRNIEGKEFRRAESAVVESVIGFGQGVSVGDVDADGFPDLYVANAGGRNCLYRNQGDGTFEEVLLPESDAGNRWTTSCAVADFNGDGLADIYEVNYVQGEDVFQRICKDETGHPAICMPFDFDGAEDVVWINDGRGSFVNATSLFLQSPATGKGLGIVVAAFADDGLLGGYVANDTTANHFWIPRRGSDGSVTWGDQAAVSGLALNESGKAEGSMGIAVSDIDANGQLDLAVTNFLYESNTLYLGRGSGLYEDATRKLGLQDASQNVLGFGTQFIDIDLDGQMELVVANGHIDDLRRKERPYRMPTQLFRMSSGRFQLVDGAGVGPYFREAWLGRAVAKCDWNRDGRMDLLIGHLYDPSKMLTNTTSTESHYLSVRLVGVRSSRDAIGAVVRLRVGDQWFVQQMVAGDGYQCSNEKVLIFGLGPVSRIDEIEVRWPSGDREVFMGGKVDQERLLVEGDGAPIAKS